MNASHKHADLIIQWANGAQIEYMHDGEWWQTDRPQWHDDFEYRVKSSKPAQEPEPVAWIAKDHATNKYFATSKLVKDAFPVYTTPPDAAKRIAELEAALEAAAALSIAMSNLAFDRARKIDYLESRINNGVRVYAEPGFDGDIEAYERWHKPSNATLLLD